MRTRGAPGDVHHVCLVSPRAVCLLPAVQCRGVLVGVQQHKDVQTHTTQTHRAVFEVLLRTDCLHTVPPAWLLD